MKALIVEPSRMIRNVFVSLFSKNNISAIAVETATEALVSLEAEHVDFLCFSMQLKDMTGIDFFVQAKERGLIGNGILLTLYLLLIGRGLMIATNASTLFSRVLAGSITLSFFTYVFVNMGMVSGILPVVGVPLPFMSYGGTALVTLFLGMGILKSIQSHRMLVKK